MKIVHRQTDGVAVLELHGKMTGEVDLAAVHDSLQELADRGQLRAIFNLENVPWVDSRGLGALIRAYYGYAQRSGRLRLCCPNPRVDEALFTIDLRNILDVHATESGALASFIERWEGEA